MQEGHHRWRRNRRSGNCWSECRSGATVLCEVDDGGPLAQEIRHQHPSTDITIVHSRSQILNPHTSSSTGDSSPKAWSAAPTPAQYSPSIERKLKDLDIHLILNEKVQIPNFEADIAEGEWDGSFGYQGQMKTVRLSSGKAAEADFIFLAVGNRANSSVVEKADPRALIDGMGKMVDVDDYFKASLVTMALLGK